MNKILLGVIDDFAEEQAKGFDLNHSGSDTFFIVRSKNKLFAYKDSCPHYGDTTLPWKRHHYLNNVAEYIVCAAHGALFQIENGKCIQGPCLGQKLTKVPIEISEQNEIWIDQTIIKEFNL
ncbi:MAG: Rieske 2Fe-2S domain-containing protein [Paraglaciecola sp.]|uniref:Rieske (2Fe-2S) protein n=1 Tax=Paraglaciecola sp. TaxID=1920173 RepID=UPI00273F4625|nr:Rieske 2Fe-2S domain-containing protein [Paraglaciecola sp.]MDP5033035.1 Rieske 2Fe-2S domain-containing protein [Paraglaciecola sp.]MDP5133720.1 Rieske 2Fe-2S domain-containing protein [Paraglaciecola sp.]